MNAALPHETLRISREKRVLNEFEAKIQNEATVEKVIESRRVSHSSEFSHVLLRCECDDQACTDTISISVEEYQHMHLKTMNFIVSRNHVNFDLEEVISSFANYVLVAKVFPASRVQKDKKNV